MGSLGTMTLLIYTPAIAMFAIAFVRLLRFCICVEKTRDNTSWVLHPALPVLVGTSPPIGEEAHLRRKLLGSLVWFLRLGFWAFLVQIMVALVLEFYLEA